MGEALAYLAEASWARGKLAQTWGQLMRYFALGSELALVAKYLIHNGKFV